MVLWEQTSDVLKPGGNDTKLTLQFLKAKNNPPKKKEQTWREEARGQHVIVFYRHTFLGIAITLSMETESNLQLFRYILCP